MEYVRVSQASRRSANDPPHAKYESYGDELADLKSQKREIEARLGAEYSKSAYQRWQVTIRGKFGAAGYGGVEKLKAWVNKRAELDEQKSSLVLQRNKLEEKIAQIKPRARQEESSRTTGGLYKTDGSIDARAVLMAILDELRHLNASVGRLSQEK